MNTLLLPGMCDDNLEIFYHQEKQKLFAIENGKIKEWSDFKNKSILKEILNQEPETKTILQNWFPNDEDAQLQKLSICRFGGLNQEPDFNQSTKVFLPDHIDCPVREFCTGNGKVCQNMNYLDVELTENDLHAINLISSDLKNIAIADELGMPLGSYEVYRTNLYKKLNIRTKPELTRVGVLLGIC